MAHHFEATVRFYGRTAISFSLFFARDRWSLDEFSVIKLLIVVQVFRRLHHGSVKSAQKAIFDILAIDVLLSRPFFVFELFQYFFIDLDSVEED